MLISCYSLTAIAQRAEKLLTDGGSIVTLTYYGAEQWMPDVIQTLGGQMRALNLPVDSLGNLSTLSDRLLQEAESHRVSPPLPAILGAWAHKPES